MTSDGHDGPSHVTIGNQDGPAEQYHHLLLGFPPPHSNLMEETRFNEQKTTLLVRSCGPMDRILEEVNFRGVVVLPEDRHLAMGSDPLKAGNPMRSVALQGMDYTSGAYPCHELRRDASILKAHLAASVQSSINRYEKLFDANCRKVFLEKRDSDRFYSTERAERPTSGIQRRSIRNFSSACLTLRSSSENVAAVILERASLADQIALFTMAGVVIAQLGAALASAVWCRPGTRVIEKAPRGHRPSCFPHLSRIFDPDHRFVPQTDAHGDCDIPQLIDQATGPWMIQKTGRRFRLACSGRGRDVAFRIRQIC